MIAIIIPTLNEERFIEKCLDSVRQQTFPFEEMDVMVVDGGSKDLTQDIVKRYSLRYPNVRLLVNPKKIQSAAFNLGFQNTDAEIVIRLDAHARYNEVYVECCVKHLKFNPEIGNVGGILNILPQYKGLIPEANALLNQSRFGIGGASYRIGAKLGYVETVPFGAFPRMVINEIGGMREDLPRGEDNEYNHRIRKSGYKILLDPQIVATYYARDTIWQSMKQMYQNGESIGKLTDIDIEIISIRHFVPLLFVIILILGILLSPFYWFFAAIFGTVLGLYLIMDVVASVWVSLDHGLKYVTVLPIMFPAIHISYGWGTLKYLFEGQKHKYKFGLLAVLALPFHICKLTFKLITQKA